MIDPEGIMLSKISWTEKYGMTLLICEIKKIPRRKKKTHRKRDYICGYQRCRVEGNWMKLVDRQVQPSSYKINKYWDVTFNMMTTFNVMFNTAVQYI